MGTAEQLRRKATIQDALGDEHRARDEGRVPPPVARVRRWHPWHDTSVAERLSTVPDRRYGKWAIEEEPVEAAGAVHAKRARRLGRLETGFPTATIGFPVFNQRATFLSSQARGHF